LRTFICGEVARCCSRRECYVESFHPVVGVQLSVMPGLVNVNRAAVSIKRWYESSSLTVGQRRVAEPSAERVAQRSGIVFGRKKAEPRSLDGENLWSVILVKSE